MKPKAKLGSGYVGMKLGVIIKTRAYNVVRYTHAGFPQQNGLELSQNQRQQLETLGGNVLSEYTPDAHDDGVAWSPEFKPGEAYTYNDWVAPWKLRTLGQKTPNPLIYSTDHDDLSLRLNTKTLIKDYTLYHREHMISKYTGADGALVNYHDSNPAGQSYGFNTRSVMEKFSNADADVANLKVNECKKFLKSSMPIKRSINKAFVYDNHAEMTTLGPKYTMYLTNLNDPLVKNLVSTKFYYYYQKYLTVRVMRVSSTRDESIQMRASAEI